MLVISNLQSNASLTARACDLLFAVLQDVSCEGSRKGKEERWKSDEKEKRTKKREREVSKE